MTTLTIARRLAAMLLALVAPALLGGCATSRTPYDTFDPEPLSDEIIEYNAPRIGPLITPENDPFALPPGERT